MQGSERRDDRVDLDAIKERSLVAFLEQILGVDGRNHGGYVTFSACPACGASGDPKSTRISVRDDRTYKCFSCESNGSILDAAMAHYGVKDVIEAARSIDGSCRTIVAAKPRPDRSVREAEAKAKADLMRTVFSKIQAACQAFKDEPVCLNYLLNERKLPMQVIRKAQLSGMVGFLPSKSTAATDVLLQAVGQDLLQQSGLWKPDKRLPGIAYRPLVFFLPGNSSAEFRLVGEIKEGWNKSIRYGTLEFPYWWHGSNPQCMIVEGGIDTLSAVALGFHGHVMGLPGCNSFREDWFPKASALHGIKRWVVALDNDLEVEGNPGQKWAAKLLATLKDQGLPAMIRAPREGDINDILRARSVADELKES